MRGRGELQSFRQAKSPKYRVLRPKRTPIVLPIESHDKIGGKMMTKPSISRKLLIEIKLNDQPQYRIAQAAGIHPNLLSKLIHNAVPIRPGDERVIRVGEVLGLRPEEVFA